LRQRERLRAAQRVDFTGFASGYYDLGSSAPMVGCRRFSPGAQGVADWVDFLRKTPSGSPVLWFAKAQNEPFLGMVDCA
jgi:hypothetical protein